MKRAKKRLWPGPRQQPDPTPDIEAEIAKLLDTLSKSTEKVAPKLARRQGPMLIINEQGTRSPLIWIFNSWAEALILARTLGPDQPLVALVSLRDQKLSVADHEMLLPHLMYAYAELAQPFVGEGRFVVGGNCQAARIGEGVAHQLCFRAKRVPLLILLDHVPFYAYPGTILMLFGTESRGFNPFLHGLRLEDSWHSSHGTAAWGFLASKHGQFFIKPGLDDLSNHVQQAITTYGETGTLAPGEAELRP